jgi:hypothetical protein
MTVLARTSSNLLEIDVDRKTETMVQHTGEKISEKHLS